MDNPLTDRSWFRSRGGRRFGIEFGAIIAIKLALLILLWFVCFRPHPRPDTRPAAVEDHLLAPVQESAHDR
ncbi:MAG: cytochrome oxidase putative small subunit CydP [Dokdonella sp.]|uniref:cytochrome oxidase putative small subunit CydP n=1 Tax=Dokdonella sp. TaxID=2291710 RepID=UPI0032639504